MLLKIMKLKKQSFKGYSTSLWIGMATSIFFAGFLSYPTLVKKGTWSPPQASSAPITAAESLDVCFTPNESCLPKVLKAIDNAKSSILLLGYSFTSKPITDSLIKAKKRGVQVRMIFDHSQKSQKHSMAVIQALIKEKIGIRFDHSVKIAHNKIVVIDNQQILTGSYNWTHAAEFKNAENLVFIKSLEVAKKYSTYFEARWKVSKVSQT